MQQRLQEVSAGGLSSWMAEKWQKQPVVATVCGERAQVDGSDVNFNRVFTAFLDLAAHSPKHQHFTFCRLCCTRDTEISAR